MKLNRLAGLAGIAALILASAASAAPEKGCFFVRDIGDRVAAGPHTLYFKVKDIDHMHAVAYFHVETKGDCVTGGTPRHEAFEVLSGILSSRHAEMICKPADVQIRSEIACPIDTIEPMTPQEVAALPHLIRP
ncbi:hypothetical protein [Phenylobacterium sp.]|uniref:hypothetical protein n=1 Tax=Phenylobacterium sp. TaxID=1871053 RepID=UPI00120B3144|nr:hypothetical protein [Phenylobacterium sp.]THD61865.1 MAG: hypothetical protein E8A49_09110 [Phenylobacterium sp.]